MADKYIKQVNGTLTEAEAIASSAGAGDDGKIPALNASGILADNVLNAAETGVSKVVKTKSTGLLDASIMPTGIGADTDAIVASEALSAGNFVNVYDNASTPNCRKTDATTAGKEADGFVLASVESAATATVYFAGINNQVSGLTGGSDYFLDTTAGGANATAPSATANVQQPVGKALSTTELTFVRGRPITLA